MSHLSQRLFILSNTTQYTSNVFELRQAQPNFLELLAALQTFAAQERDLHVQDTSISTHIYAPDTFPINIDHAMFNMPQAQL